MTCLLQKLDPNIPLDAAVGGCLTTAFYSIARVGEFTILNLLAFDLTIYVKCSDIHYKKDCNGFASTVFHLPCTKTSQAGKDVFWAKQLGLMDQDAALANHFHVNEPPINSTLFSYRHGNTHCPLTNVPFDVMKTMGHWASDAFQLYLCNHAQILALYLQATPALQDKYLHYTMPHIH
ncbi:hypothetical protein BDR05DRAFT_975427 [Suillus weaverae]|nr:hypothetical protein BDR05DRAFT_975427 [Suillus weaverae]